MVGFFGIEPLIVEHLRAEVPEALEVSTPISIEDMLSSTNIAPSIAVIWHDLRIGEVAPGKVHAATYHQWMIVLNVRHAGAQLKDTNMIRAAADPMIRKILKAMKGFKPEGHHNKFKWVNCPIRAGGQAGQAYFPFLFEIQKLE